MQKEELHVRKRLIELSTISYQRGIATYSDFLNLNELNILHTTPPNTFLTSYDVFGGYACSERQMAVFLPDALSCTAIYPIKRIQIEPVQKKFSECLNHRDYLGAILGLGIERSTIGDIIVSDYEAIVFVHEKIAPFILDSLSCIRHTSVTTKLVEEADFVYTPRYEEIRGTVASVRLDAIISLVLPASRNKLTAYISSGKVFVNGKLITTNAYRVKEDDIISIRGLGKFAYKGLLSQTKKGRFYIMLHKYI